MKQRFFFALVILSFAYAKAEQRTPYPKTQTHSINIGATGILIAETIQIDPLSVETKVFILKNSERISVNIPEELKNREILGVFKADTSSAWIVSQWVIEMGDKPLISQYNFKNFEWSELARVNCIAHRGITMQAQGLEFSCLEDEIVEGKYVEKLTVKSVQLR